MRIYLIGYMGSGKTKTAEALSKIFKYELIDLDRIIEDEAGISIGTIFKNKGQEYFREIEKEALISTGSKNNCIISTGGGTPCFFDNMNWMNSHGITVYLEANPGLLFHRLATSRIGRPLIEKLNDVELMEQITGQLAMRIPFYQKAMITVKAASLNVKDLSEKIKTYNKK